MIDSMYQDRIDRNLDDQVKRPATDAVPAPGTFTGFLKGLGGVPAGFLDAGAGSAELAGGYGQVMAGTGAMSAGGMFSTQSDAERAQTEAARNKIATQGVDMSNATGDTLRAKAKDFMPDPNTTGAAGQILGGLANFGGQAVLAGMAGPAGLVNLGVDRGLSRADELKQQGVDIDTRTAVGAVSGATDAASMLLPMSGATRLVRAGKGAAGGVASTVATTEAQKLILEHQGYDKIASTMDPFDPVSLALSSLVPAGFGAAFGHGAPAPGRGAHPGEPTRADVLLTPEEQAHSNAVEANSIDSNIADLQKEIAGQQDAGARQVLQTELDRLTKQKQAGVARAAAQDPNTVAAARTQQAADAMDASRLTPDDDVVGHDQHQQAVETAADQIARGEPVNVADILSDRLATFEPATVEDSMRRQLPGLRATFDNGLGNEGEMNLAINDGRLYPTWVHSGEFEAPGTLAKRSTGGKVTALYEHAIGEAEARGLQFTSDASVTPEAARVYDALERRGYDVERNPTARLAESPEVISPRYLTDDGQPVFKVSRGSAARPRATDLPRAVAEIQSARAPAATKPDHASFKAAAAEAESSAGAGGAPAAAPGASPLAAQSAALAHLNPDMLVHMDGMDAPMRMSDLLEHLAQEAKETKRDANLLQVAAQCALSFGVT